MPHPGASVKAAEGVGVATARLAGTSPRSHNARRMLDVSAPRLSEACNDYLALHTRALREAVHAGQDGVLVADRYARMFDGLLGSLCCAGHALAQQDAPALGRVALVAVGGYGRRQVAPHSDVDVLFLCDDPSNPGIADLAERVLYPLWDAGVDIGHVVRGLEETLELSRTDIRTSTTLLDMRHVAGDRTIMAELAQRGRQEIFEEMIEQFLEALESDTVSRHERFGGSLYLREPDLKLGRGGLRDLDVMLWSARARWAVDTADELVAVGALTEHELRELSAARRHLWNVRNRLHVAAGRRQDRLTFDDQEVLAKLLGYADGATLGVEQFMQRHYLHARVIARLVDCMGNRVRRSRRVRPSTLRDLGDGVLAHDGRILLQRMDLAEEPAVALSLYEAVVREGLPPDMELRDAVAAAASDRDWGRRLRRDPQAGAAFLRLLARAEPAPVRRGSILEELHDVGLLLALIPELEAVTGRVRHDAFHVYTVDAHSVMAVDRLKALARGEFAADHVSLSRCAAEMPRPVPVVLALLLHGLGEGHPDDAARHGAAIAGPIAARLGLGAADIGHVQWLIANQSSMYHWATRRDITDPDVIAEVAREVETVDRLRDLYLATYASVSTLNPGAMTAWNARMLDDLFHAVSSTIEGRATSSDRIERLRREATEGVSDPEHRRAIEEFLGGVPDRYLLANTVAGVRWHASVAARRQGRLALGHVDSGVGRGTLELVVATDDRPGLLADITGALAAGRFSIDWAQLYTRTRVGAPDEAFDLFHVSHPNMDSPEQMEVEIESLRHNLEQIIAGRMTTETLLAGRSRRPSWTREGPRIRTEIHADNQASRAYTVVDVYTRDRPQLLHAIARTLHEAGLSIALAKVNTEGQRVADVFYVQTATGGKLSGRGDLSALSRALHDTIRKLDAAESGVTA